MKYKFILFSPWLLKSPEKGSVFKCPGLSFNCTMWSMMMLCNHGDGVIYPEIII